MSVGGGSCSAVSARNQLSSFFLSKHAYIDLHDRVVPRDGSQASPLSVLFLFARLQLADELGKTLGQRLVCCFGINLVQLVVEPTIQSLWSSGHPRPSCFLIAFSAHLIISLSTGHPAALRSPGDDPMLGSAIRCPAALQNFPLQANLSQQRRPKALANLTVRAEPFPSIYVPVIS